MSEQDKPGGGRPNPPRFLRRRWWGLLSLLLVACVAVPWISWPARASHQGATIGPSMSANPTSGLAGSTVSISGTGYFRISDQGPAPITFDGASLGTVSIRVCQNAGGFGFGTDCDGTAVTITVPQTAAPGPHTITVTGVDANLHPAYPASATFTVSAPAPPASLILSPTSGAAGSTTSISLIGVPIATFSQTAALTFDGAPIGQQQIVACSSNLQGAGGSGFGAACTGNAFFDQIPSGAQPGPHTVTATISSPAGAAPTTVSATFTVVVTTTPAMTLDPTSGLAGSTISVTVIDLPNTTAGQTATISFGNGVLGAVPVQQCTAGGAAGTYGLGLGCAGNVVSEPVPQTAPPGTATITAVVSAPNDPAGSITVSASFTVLPPNATGTATATSTSVPVTGTPTNTPPAVTATSTATSTPTATPVPHPFVVLVKPAFSADRLLIAARGGAGAKVKLEIRVFAFDQGALSVKYLQKASGVTNKQGLYSTTLQIHYPSHAPGRAQVSVMILQAGKTTTARQWFSYP